MHVKLEGGVTGYYTECRVCGVYNWEETMKKVNRSWFCARCWKEHLVLWQWLGRGAKLGS